MTATTTATLKDFLWRLEQSSGHSAAQKLLDDNPDLEQMLRTADSAQTADSTSQDSPVGELAAAVDLLRTARFAGAMTATPAVAALVRARVPLADWLGCIAALDPSESGGDTCGWCGNDHALAVARALNAA